jgi:hypothetical protein
MSEACVHNYTGDQLEIIKAVLYFEIFDYPLTVTELYENSAISMSREAFDVELQRLVEDTILSRNGDFVLSRNGTESIINRRKKGNEAAGIVMPTAYRYSKKIASFPFVEGICLSGGLSKQYYDEHGDIDFFIITKPGRLWLCRTFLIVRYKLLPKHLKKYWCVNYFIASSNLSIPENNVFTGTEMAYLIPTVNYDVYENLLQQNAWYKKRFPNKAVHPGANCIATPEPLMKRLVERFLGGRFGNFVDDLLLRTTLKHWRKKYPEMKEEDFELQFRSRKDVCKRHTKGFQNIVLTKWEQKQQEYEKILTTLAI